MDNQQETVSLFELGWFCGFVDGEGAIGISIRNRNEGKRIFTPKPHLQISNTEYSLIERCMSVLERLNVPFHISHYPSPTGNRKEYWTLIIAGQKRVMKILPIIQPLLQSCKSLKAKLVMEFCTLRESSIKGQGYSDYEMSIIDRLYKLNKRGLNEQAPQRLHAKHFNLSDDIVQTTTD